MTSVISEVKLVQKVASAVGLSNKKPISDGEDMGPAGHMQGRCASSAMEHEGLLEEPGFSLLNSTESIRLFLVTIQALTCELCL